MQNVSPKKYKNVVIMGDTNLFFRIQADKLKNYILGCFFKKYIFI